jgi:hypothetical protein
MRLTRRALLAAITALPFVRLIQRDEVIVLHIPTGARDVEYRFNGVPIDDDVVGVQEIDRTEMFWARLDEPPVVRKSRA